MVELHEPIASCCKKLRLSSNLADMAMITTVESNQEYLYNLLQKEIEYRYNARVVKLMNTAGFPKRYAVEQFKDDEIDFPEGVTLDALLNLDFYTKGKNIIMYGGSGTGKTMLSILIGISSCRKCVPVKFYRTAGLINMFSESKQKGNLLALKRKLNSAEIIILDEFGYVPYDRTGAQLLFDYLSDIHKRNLICLPDGSVPHVKDNFEF